ncbi:hypothetical protein [Desulfotomaculum copahuensis]|uniref:hypothetical protein n=1 Tax=Desulfotomaculum copahuensis TaxID=1838280 RepID=UPI000AFA22BD|nr:hypothetical protein [Desulfotomaculum copahuensis]
MPESLPVSVNGRKCAEKIDLTLTAGARDYIIKHCRVNPPAITIDTFTSNS